MERAARRQRCVLCAGAEPGRSGTPPAQRRARHLHAVRQRRGASCGRAKVPAMIDPDARALLALIEERGVPAVHTLSPDEARRSYRGRRFFTQPEPPEVASVRDVQADGVPLRVYRPAGAANEARLPVLVYFHGGGWTIGDLDTHDVLCASIALGARCAVFSVDYRLAPEHPFPAAVDGCWAATRYVAEQARELGCHGIALGGDRRGG